MIGTVMRWTRESGRGCWRTRLAGTSRCLGTRTVISTTWWGSEPVVTTSGSFSDVIAAVLVAGFILELFHEQSYTNAPWPWTERGDDGYYRLPEGSPRFPLTYSLRARLH